MPDMNMTRDQKAVTFVKSDVHSAGTITGTGVDCLGFETLKVIVSAGTANTSYDIHMEESDASGSGYANITGAVFTQVTTSNDDAIYEGIVNLRPRKRYIRAILVVTGTAGDVAILGVLSGGREQPSSTAQWEV